MKQNLYDKLGQGLAPNNFIKNMEKNKEAFQSWYDSFRWNSEEDQEFFQSFQFRDDIRCIILAAEWCGDVVRNVPPVLRALEETQIPVEILIMEDHLDVMDQFLTMGGRAIPIVIFTDTGGLVLEQWGPRPEHVQSVMRDFKNKYPDREAPEYQEKIKEARSEMMKQYGEGSEYQHVIVQELRERLSRV